MFSVTGPLLLLLVLLWEPQLANARASKTNSPKLYKQRFIIDFSFSSQSVSIKQLRQKPQAVPITALLYGRVHELIPPGSVASEPAIQSFHLAPGAPPTVEILPRWRQSPLPGFEIASGCETSLAKPRRNHATVQPPNALASSTRRRDENLARAVLCRGTATRYSTNLPPQLHATSAFPSIDGIQSNR